MTQTLQTTQIREAVLDDAAPIARLLGELGFPSAPESVRQRLRSMLAFGESVLVAQHDDDLLGVLTVHVTPVLHRPDPVGRLTALVVTERERGSGIGRALVDAAERLLRDKGCGTVEVTSNRKLEQAHAFYRHLGYEESSTRFKKDLH